MDSTRTSGSPTGRGSPEQVWHIRDFSGRLYGNHHRIGDGENKKVWWSEHAASGLSPKEFPFYGSEQADAWHPDEPVIIGEGEKVRDALHEAGYATLGTLGTSHLPADRFFELLHGRTVVIVPDNDTPGREHMEKIAEKAYGVGAKVLWYEWKDAPPKGDLADHPVVQHGSAEKRERLLDELWDAPRWEPKKPEGLQGRVLLGQMLLGGIDPTKQLVDGLIYVGRIHAIASSPGTGKTLLALWIALYVVKSGLKALYLDAENGPALTAQRLGDLGATPEILDEGLHYYGAEIDLSPQSLAALMTTVGQVRPDLIVFDSLADFLALAGLEENSNSDVTLWMTRVVQPLKDAGVAVLILDHVPKGTGKGPRGASSKVAKLDVLWNLEVTLGFDRERTGQITLKAGKDREAWLPRMVQFSVGGGVFARSEGTIEQRDGDGLTDSQRTALEALEPHPEGLTYSEWLGACGLIKTTFDKARLHLRDEGLIRNERQRWYASGSSTPPSTLGPRRSSEPGTIGQVHSAGTEEQKDLQKSGTFDQNVPEMYFDEQAKTVGTLPPHTLNGCGSVPMAGVLESNPLSTLEIATELGRPNSGPAKMLDVYLQDPTRQRLRYLTCSVLVARGLPADDWEPHAAAVERAAADPDNHPLGCGCGGCL